jgi:hypothetical protein
MSLLPPTIKALAVVVSINMPLHKLMAEMSLTLRVQ